MNSRSLTLFTLIGLISAGTLQADPNAAQHADFFETSIRPLLANSCVECHGEQRAEAGLRLDTREGILKGGDFGKVVKLSDPRSSSLLLAVRHEGEEQGISNMPEDKPRLGNPEIEALTRWLELGMPWPDHGDAKAAIAAKNDLRDHWSFKPLQVSTPPKGAKNPIDAFILQSQKEKNLKPAPKADKYTLIRRAYFDMVGLPPSYEDIQKWEKQPLDKLYQHLLDSPHYGERWGRHWLDVARYSDVKGYEAGGRERRFVYSFTYRDWVIRALNEDMPYDKFLLYQIAAEQLIDEKSKEHLAAMGFLTLARSGSAHLVIDDQIDTTFRGLMGLTVSCARCHDHKFDPIPTRDYYSLYGVFKNSVEPEEAPILREPDDTPEFRTYKAKLDELQKEVDDFLAPKLAEQAEKFPNIANRPFQLEAKLDREAKVELRNLRNKVDKFIANSEFAPDRALILKDTENPSDANIFVRGNPGNRGDRVPRQFLSVVAGPDQQPFQKGSGRLEMAQAIADHDNPLTARVLVNRVWMHHFGKGLVTTPSDFGHQGELPSHPALLDWLANWFMDNGWSLKKLHTLILTSDTWQQASIHPDAHKQQLIDPENRMLWHFNRQRLDFESMRDSYLAVNGSLDEKLFGRSVEIEDAPYPTRRTVYAFIDRQNLPPVFKTFDFANPQEHTPKRAYTTVPTQGLFTLNHPFILENARKTVAHAGLHDISKPQDRINALYKAVYGREPDPLEMELSMKFIVSQSQEQREDPLAGQRQNATPWQYGYGNYDVETKKGDFTKFEVWDKDQWQPTDEYPVKNSPLSYLNLHDGGGHPGSGPTHASVIRWTAPFDVTISVEGELARSSDKGDPVRGRIVKNSSTLLKEAVCEPAKSAATDLTTIPMAKGDTLDFYVDCFGNTSFDSYSWAPIIRNVDAVGEKWDYNEQFSGPSRPATVWEMYAQALLATNEFMFVD